MENNNKKGFTIVELVIVIAVIAILAAVLIPTFAGIVSKANKSAALQEAQSVYKEVYALDLSDGSHDGDITSDKYTSEGGVLKGSYTYSKDTFEYTTAKGYKAIFNGTAWTVEAPSEEEN